MRNRHPASFYLAAKFPELAADASAGFQVAVRSELVVGGFRVAPETLGGLYFLGYTRGQNCEAGAVPLESCIEPGREPRKKAQVADENDRETSHADLSEGWQVYSIHTSNLAGMSRRSPHRWAGRGSSVDLLSFADM